MFDIGWTELLVIGVVALVVVGPKDLPVMFKTFGRIVARARGMAREFSRAMEAAADEAGLKDVANDLKTATNPVSSGIDRLKEAADRFEKWEPGRPAQPPAPAAQPAATPTAPAAASAPAQPAASASAAAPVQAASAADPAPAPVADSAPAAVAAGPSPDPKAQA